MSKYYYLIAGLPSITPDDAKLTYSVTDFKAEIADYLSKHDKQLMRWLYLKYDNRNLLLVIRNLPEDRFDARSNFSLSDLQHVFHALKANERPPKKNATPSYMTKFIQSYLKRLEDEETADFQSLEDHLSALYYEEAMKCGNKFLASWFELNLNMGNVLVALNCRKYGLNKEHFIIGENEIAQSLRTSGARDFHLGELDDYMTRLMQIADMKEPMAREKQLDLLRWKWLEDYTFYRVFDIESIMAYMLQLEILERWIALDKTSGDKTFRQLVLDMKQESVDTLEKFKENNK